jgi:hypothetical protein
MTRKHYKIIAQAMAESKPKGTNESYSNDIVVWKATVETLAMYLRHNNANFDKDKFLDACNYYK